MAYNKDVKVRRFSLYMDSDIDRNIRSLAMKNDCSLNKFINNILRNFLNNKNKNIKLHYFKEVLVKVSLDADNSIDVELF